MDLQTSPYQQMEALANWLEDNSRSESLPGQAVWEGFRQQMEDRAIFIRTFMLRNMSREEPRNIPNSTLDRSGHAEEGVGPVFRPGQRPNILASVENGEQPG